MLFSYNKRLLLSLALVALLFSPTLHAQNPANDALLKCIPSKTLLCVRINNFNNTLTQMDQFLAGASPIGISALAKSQIMNILGSSELAGLDMNGNVAVIVTETSGEIQPGIPDIYAGMLIPVTDYKQFINGISNKTPADENGVSTIISLGNPIILVTEYNQFALLSWKNDYNKMLEFKNQANTASKENILNNLDSDEAKLAVSEPVWIYGNMQQTSKTYSPVLLGAIESMKAIVGSMDQANTGMPADSIQNILNMYVSIIETALNEIKSASIVIDPQTDSLNITKTITAVPGTDLARMFDSESSTQVENNLLAYLEDGALMNYAFNTNASFWNKTSDFQIELLTMLFGENVSKEEINKLKSMMTSVMECMGGSAVYSISSSNNMKPPFYGYYVIAIKDEDKFSQLLDQASEFMTTMGFLDFYKNMGLDVSFTINKDVDTYKGISIDAAKFSMKTNQANNPQSQMIESMYGEGFDYRWAIVNGFFACTIGTDADVTIHELIDKIQSSQPKQVCDEIKSAISILPEIKKSDLFMTINVLRLYNMITSMIDSNMIPISLPQLKDTGTSNIIISGKTNNEKMTIDMALPKQHLLEIMNAVLSMQQQMIQNLQ